MWPPVRPTRDSMSGGPHLGVPMQSLKSGEVLDEVDELLLHLGPTAVPGALRELVGPVLTEHADQVLALWCRGRS